MDFNQKYLKQSKACIIAVDYDSTITLHRPYPILAPLNPKAKKYLDKLNAKGFKLVLWSARSKEDYEDAYNRCINEFGLNYMQKDSENLIHGSTGKLVASYYIDDLSVPGKLNWKKTYKFLIKKYKKILKK